MYYWNIEEDALMREGKSVPLGECQEVVVKDMTRSKETGFTFKVNTGERLYHLMT